MSFLKSCVKETDFDRFTHASMTKKIEDGLTDGWAWHSSYKAVHFVDTQSSSLKSSVEINLGFLKAGDVIEISAEFMNISGVKGKIALEFSQSANMSSSTRLYSVSSTHTNIFENLTSSFMCDQDGYYNVVFGTWTAEVSDFYVRDCVVKVQTIVTNETSTTNLASWFSARRDTALMVANASNTQMTFETSHNNHGANFAQIDSATGRIKFLETGVYEIYSHTSFAQNSTGDRFVSISHSAEGSLPLTSLFTAISVCVLHEATANSLLDFFVRQTSGGDLGVTGNIRIRKIANL